MLTLVSSVSVVVPLKAVVSEDFMYPLRIERHINKDSGSPGEGTASAVDAHAHDDFAFLLLAHQWATVVFITHSLVFSPSSTHFIFSDGEAATVELGTQFIADHGQAHRFEGFLISCTFGFSPSIHEAVGTLHNTTPCHRELDGEGMLRQWCWLGQFEQGQVGTFRTTDHMGYVEPGVEGGGVEVEEAHLNTILTQVRNTGGEALLVC